MTDFNSIESFQQIKGRVQRDRETERQRDRETERQRDRETEAETETYRDRQADRDRQTDIQADKLSGCLAGCPLSLSPSSLSALVSASAFAVALLS